MTNNNHISEIWEALEEEKNVGLVKRLYSSDVSLHIYGTFQYPERYYGVAFTFSNNIRIDTSPFDNLRELKVMYLADTTFSNSRLLIIQLVHPNSRDVFAILCENLIQSVIRLNTEQNISRKIVNQLEKWKTLFEKNNSTGLTPAEQQGLFGELHFLQKFLSCQNTNLSKVLLTWVGGDKALRDFQGNNWAVEVKTTSTNNPQKVMINGERQLDETLFENLFLFHFSIEVSNGNGQTLSQKVAEIRKNLENDTPALSIFKVKLLEAGYLDKHEAIYQNRFYQARDENYYKIEADFPRIKEKELRKAVCDVKYSIILAMCDEYLISENQIFTAIKEL
ncbi:PD-(D/E)XK motif protein [Dysgonomonas sp. Marseille-P4677]|uniref:PD-(D/E)XK motif protein n=1 Tax=Dysgonomonas sp. Marseille-P4677 TaxID=2364790 RepID=UPI001914CDEF|nr:PD-(D/E)XK motif protein [Dysgonomonas sp. Marseille-P4677]MBK5719544.1 PD-(D/E)XK motif protein [Dysgonomonas sp. Marseille-P4677]